MCGLNGLVIQTDHGFNNLQLSAAMANIWISQLRGRDSTGIVAVNNKGGALWQKEVGSPDVLFSSDEWKEIHKGLFKEGNLIFGHNRAATRGDVTIDNAHPFARFKKDKEHKIILVHNGTLHTYQDQLEGLNSFTVDSEWLADCVAIKGPVETFSKVNGPIATIWWDTEEKTLNIYRNNERPLFCVRTKEGDIYLNSEVSALMWLKFHFHLNFERSDITSFEALNHYWLEHGKYRANWKKQEIPKIIKRIEHSNPHRTPFIMGENPDFHDNSMEGRRRRFQKNRELAAGWEHRTGRNFVSDARAIVRRELTEVQFVAGNRRTSLPHSLFWTQNVEPYVPDLTRMTLASDGSKVLCFYEADEGVTKYTIETTPDQGPWPDQRTPDDTNVEPAALLLSANKSDAVKEYIGGEFIPGSKRKWKTKTRDGRKINHSAQISPNHERHFTEYTNSIDGSFKIGDEVSIEIYSVEARQIGKLWFEVHGTEVKDGADMFVDFYYFSRGKSKEEIEAEGFVRGKITMMRIATVKEFNTSGTLVSIMLEDPEVLTVMKTEDAVAERTIIIPNGVNESAN